MAVAVSRLVSYGGTVDGGTNGGLKPPREDALYLSERGDGATGSPMYETTAPVSPVAVALAGMAALAVMMGIGRFAFTPIFRMMATESGLSVSVGSSLASATYAGNLLGDLSAIVVRVPAARAIRWGLVAIGTTTLAMGIACGRQFFTSAVFAGYGVGFTVAGGVCLLLMRAHASAADAWIILGVLALGVALVTWPVFGHRTDP